MRFFKYGILFCTFSSIKPVTNCYKVILAGYAYSEFIYPNYIATSLFIYNLFHIFLFNRHIREYMDTGKIVRNYIFHIIWLVSFLLYYVNYININILISTLYFAQTLDSGNPDEISQYILFYIVCAISVVIYDSLVLRMLLIFLMRNFCFYLQSHCIPFYLLNFLISTLTFLSPCYRYCLTYIISASFHYSIYLVDQENFIKWLKKDNNKANLLTTNSMPHMMLYADFCVITHNLKYLEIIDIYLSELRDLLISGTLYEIAKLNMPPYNKNSTKITICKQWLQFLTDINDSKNQDLINDFEAIIKIYEYIQNKDKSDLSEAISLCEEFNRKFGKNLQPINTDDCMKRINSFLTLLHLPTKYLSTKIDISCELSQSHYDTYIELAKYRREDLENLEKNITQNEMYRASIFNKLRKALQKAN